MAQGRQASCKVGCGRQGQRPHRPRPLSPGLSTPRAGPQPLCSGATSLYPAGAAILGVPSSAGEAGQQPLGDCPSLGPGAEETHQVGNHHDKRGNSGGEGRRTQPCPAAPRARSEDPHPASRSQEPGAPGQPRWSHLWWPQPRPAGCHTPGGTGREAGHQRTGRRVGPRPCARPRRSVSGPSATGMPAGVGRR